MSNIVAIVGRPNVGKSTLFNRLTESREAIVDEQSGVTRDRHYGKVEWNGQEFTIIDTGGYVRGSDDIFESEIRKQVELAITEATQIIFVVDVVLGVVDLDIMVAELLRKSNKKVFVVVNKVDNTQRESMNAEFYTFGLGELYNVSAINGHGTGDLLDDLVKSFDKEPDTEMLDDLPRIAIIGRPNVGKSSFTNALLGKERNIVTPLAGTTRDSIHTRYQGYGFDFWLVDTAGVRKKSKVHEDLEFYTVMRSVKTIEKSDVCIIMIDAKDGIESQDLNLFHLAEKNRKGIVIVVNKWDLVEKDTNTSKQFEEQIYHKIAPFKDIPIIFTSVINKQRIFQALETAINVYKERSKRITTSVLNETMLPLIENYPPPALKGKYVKIKFVTQLPTATPSFAFFCNLPQYVKDPYKRFLENKIREKFGFQGVPVSIFMRQK